MIMENRHIELLAATALCDGGIALPLHTILRKKPFRVVMKIPTTQSLIHISKLYLKIGVSIEEYNKYNEEQHARFVYLHGADISRIVAAGVVRGPILGALLNRPVAWLLRAYMHPIALTEAWRHILNNSSTTSFGHIITSAALINKMQLLVSQNED